MPVWHQRETSRSARQIIKKILDDAIAHSLRPKDNCGATIRMEVARQSG
jgi:hypothetical protein